MILIRRTNQKTPRFRLYLNKDSITRFGSPKAPHGIVEARKGSGIVGQQL